MLPMLHKHTVITAALIASLSLTACGSKKDVIAAPQGQTKTGNTNGKMGGGLPDPSNDKDQGDANAGGDTDYTAPPTTVPDTEVGNKGGGQTRRPPTIEDQGSDRGSNGGGVSNGGRRPTPVVVDTRPAPSVGTTTIPSDYDSSDARNVVRDNRSKRMTGAVTSDGLVYTGSSTDDILEFLRARNERVGYDTRRANEAAAKSVVSAVLSINKSSQDAVVTLRIQEGGEVRVYNVAGGAESGDANTLKSVRAGNGERTTGSRALEGTLKCLDLDGGCENTFVRLKIGSSPSSAIINIVFRNSSADLYFNLPGEYSNNPEYAVLRDFALNTIKRVQTEERVKTVRMSSWETVNGRSGVSLSMKGANNELLAFAGPLLAPEAGNRVNIPLSRIAKEKEDNLDIISLSNAKLNYANWIADARLSANNGLGQVQIVLKMRKRSSYAQDQFAVTFLRKIKPIVDLTDDNLK